MFYKLIIILFVLTGTCFAQEIIPNFDEESIPILNEELRRINNVSFDITGAESDIDDLEALHPVDLATSEVNGILTMNKGGTEANLSDPGADRIMFWDDGLTTMSWLEAGDNIAITGTSLDVDVSGSATFELITNTGSNTFDVPADVNFVDVIMVGGGGGGGSKSSGIGGGGGGGATLYTLLPYEVTPEGSITVVIGSGGGGGTPDGNGGAGGATTFDGVLTANGGAGGTSGGGGGAGGAAGTPAAPTAASGATGGSESGYVEAYVAGTAGASGGGGGASVYGSGGDLGNPGENGTGYGGAGAGGNPNQNGGAGTQGFCLIMW